MLLPRWYFSLRRSNQYSSTIFIPTWLPRLIVPMQKAEIPKLVWLVWTDADVGCQSVSGIFLSPQFETFHLSSHPSEWQWWEATVGVTLIGAFSAVNLAITAWWKRDIEQTAFSSYNEMNGQHFSWEEIDNDERIFVRRHALVSQ